MTLEEKLIRIANEHGSGDSLITKIMPIIHSYGDTREIDGRIDEEEYHLKMLKSGKWRSYATEVTERLAELKKMKGK